MRLAEIQREGVYRKERPGHWSTSALRDLAEILWEIKVLLLQFFNLLLVAVTLVIYSTLISYPVCVQPELLIFLFFININKFIIFY